MGERNLDDREAIAALHRARRHHEVGLERRASVMHAWPWARDILRGEADLEPGVRRRTRLNFEVEAAVDECRDVGKVRLLEEPMRGGNLAES